MTEEIKEDVQEQEQKPKKAKPKKAKQVFNTTNHTFYIGTSVAKPQGEMVLSDADKQDEKTMARFKHALKTGVLVEK